MRDLSWLEVVSGVFLAAVLLIAVTVVMSVATIAFPDSTVLTSKLDFVYLFPAFLAAGMAFFAWKYPGPGHIVEMPLLTVAAILVWPVIAAVALSSGASSSIVGTAFTGLLVTTLVGFAVFYAIYTEAKKAPKAKTTWPLDRPASFGWMGSRGVPINKVMMYAGIERGGPEEERPDTFVRMKTKE